MQASIPCLFGGLLVSTVFLAAAPLDDWRASFFTPAELADPAIGGLEADPDGDGVPNLLEFTFARLPWVVEPFPTTVAGLSGGQLTLTYRESHTLDAAQIWLQGSGDLRHWATYNVLTETARLTGAGHDTVTLIDPAPPGALRRFLRLRVYPTLPPPVVPSETDATLLDISTVLVEWTDPSVTETGYFLERLTPGSAE